MNFYNSALVAIRNDLNSQSDIFIVAAARCHFTLWRSDPCRTLTHSVK